MKYLIPIFFVMFFTGCDNFLGTQSSDESRASRPKPALENTKVKDDVIIDTSKTSKSAPSRPSSN